MDLRLAFRSLWKNPGFTVLAVLVMGLGIGANTAVFSVVYSVLLRPLDYHEPARIVTVSNFRKNSGAASPNVSAPDFLDWKAQSTVFSSMAFYNGGNTTVKAGPTAEYAQVAFITPEFPAVFGVQPVLGRFFDPGREPNAAILSYGFWQSHFGGKPDVLGRTIEISGRALTITGVFPPRFQFPGKTDIWYPAPDTQGAHRSGHNFRAIARLAAGVTLEQAQSQMAGIAARLEQQYPESNRNKGVLVARMQDSMVSDARFTLYLLLGAVALVLLISCANVANLLLAKATARTREIAIRAAVGASRGRIVRQLVTESLVLSLAAGAAGLVLAQWGSAALVALAPGNIPRLDETSIDAWVLAFTFGISAAASLLFGLAPALAASRVDLNHALKQSAARSLGGGTGYLRSGLVIAEVALSVVLLAGAGLLIRSLAAMNAVDLGFHPKNVLVVGTSVPAPDLAAAQRVTRFYKDLLPEIAALPGVTAVGATRVPPGRIMSNGSYFIDRLPGPQERSTSAPQAVFSIVSPGALAALGIPLKAGRDFSARDTYDAPFTALINESLARQTFGTQNPIGRVIYCGFDSDKPMQIVGIVGDIRQLGPAEPPDPELYMPYEQHPRPSTSMRLLVRATGDPTALTPTLRRMIADRSPDVPLRFTTMESTLSEVTAAPRFNTLLFSIFAALAVCLAMAGVYGVMAYAVSLRAGEIGLRMALGASPGSVLRMVLRQGLSLAAIGLAIGLAGAAAATRLLSTFLFGVQPGDPATYTAVAFVLVTAAAVASYVPARRATRVDPLVALRQE